MKKNFCILALLALAIPMHAQSDQASGKTEVMTPQKLWELGRVSLDDVSENGLVLFGVSHYNMDANRGNRDLYIGEIASGELSVLRETKASEYGAFFLRGGERIGYFSGGQLWLDKVNDISYLPLPLTDVEGGLGDAKVVELNDGRLLVTFVTRVQLDQTPAERHPEAPKANYAVYDDLMYRHWDSWTDYSYNHIAYMVVDPTKTSATGKFTDIMAGEKVHSPLPPFGGAESFDVSPDGRFIVYASKKVASGKEFALHTDSKLYLYDRETGRTSTLNGLDGYDNHPSFSPDGKWLAFVAMPEDGYESDVNQLYIVDVASAGEKRELQPVISAEYINDFKWISTSSIIFNESTQGTQQLRRLDLMTGKNGLAAKKVTTLTSGDYNYGGFGVSGNTVIAERQDQNHATELFVLNAKKEVAPGAFTVENADLYSQLAMGDIQKRWIKTSDGGNMLTWVFLPPNFDPEKKYPTLLYCQGGPQSAVSAFYSYRWNFQLMAAQGYIVVAPNRHGVPGFGKEWNEQISQDWGGQAMRDYLAAIDTVAKESYVDANNLGAVGASYGGYSVYMLAGIHENRFKALISHCGLFDMKSWYLTTEELFFANKDVGGPYWTADVPKAYTDYNPMNFVQNWTAPLLVIHGGNDFRVPVNQGMEAYQAAQLRGIPSRFLYFPEEGHWILSPQNGLVWHAEFFSWLESWLK
ncbi:S9 family peptidase [Schleiferiaceae bacterium]|nr:S9 family peptidase [Schleiferiaceae bacterium]